MFVQAKNDGEKYQQTQTYPPRFTIVLRKFQNFVDACMYVCVWGGVLNYQILVRLGQNHCPNPPPRGTRNLESNRVQLVILSAGRALCVVFALFLSCVMIAVVVVV